MSAGASIVDVCFCGHDEKLEGRVEVSALHRLREAVSGADGVLRYEIAPLRHEGKPAARVSLQGRVSLVCQRCLEPLSFDLASRRILVLAHPPADPEDEHEDVDFIGPDVRLEAMELVEEEALLCLPMIPRHPPGECPGQGSTAQAEDRPNPFAVLKASEKH